MTESSETPPLESFLVALEAIIQFAFRGQGMVSLSLSDVMSYRLGRSAKLSQKNEIQPLLEKIRQDLASLPLDCQAAAGYYAALQRGGIPEDLTLLDLEVPSPSRFLAPQASSFVIDMFRAKMRGEVLTLLLYSQQDVVREALGLFEALARYLSDVDPLPSCVEDIRQRHVRLLSLFGGQLSMASSLHNLLLLASGAGKLR